MRAAILSIGDELTIGQNLDTNSQWLAARLAEHSIFTHEHRTVFDDEAAIAAAIEDLFHAADVVITTGGLGPTADDLTREALKTVFTPEQKMVIDQAVLDHLDHWFTKRGRVMPEMNRKQALRPHTMRCLPNPNGTAPGLAGQMRAEQASVPARAVPTRVQPQRPAPRSTQVFALPGPPNEMQPMFLNHVLPALKRSESDEVLLTATVLEFGMGESVAAEKLGDLMNRDRHPLVGITASDSIVSARIRATGTRAQAQKALDETVATIERSWQPYAFGSANQSLSEVVGSLLRSAKKTLAVAESCTGGWLGKTIVDQLKSSDYFLGGWITYSNEMKTSQLGVPSELIAMHGAVSSQVAQAMAEGANHRSGADYTLAITGIAGPDGGTPAKPVGTVFIAISQRNLNDRLVSSRHFEFTGDRTIIRDRSVKAALQMLRFALLNVPENTPLIWEANEELLRIRLAEMRWQ